MNEIPNLNCEYGSTILEFKEVPEFINVSNQSLNYQTENPNEFLKSEIILLLDNNKFSLIRRFSMKLNIQDIVDWVTK